MTEDLQLFITCPRGVEGLLGQELERMGAANPKPTIAGVSATGDLNLAYRACLWSRLASKVLLLLGQSEAKDADSLYRGVQQINWLDHLAADGKLWIEVNGTNHALRNSQFSAQLVKDAIVDQIRNANDKGIRPLIDRDNPDLIVNVHIKRDVASINIDLSGPSLHKRGYRIQPVVAPLKENLAAALLVRSGWLDVAKQGGDLIDPMCGSGTFLIEAAMMAADIAPGLLRDRFAFMKWPGHQPELWQALIDEAEQRRETGLDNCHLEIRGYDVHYAAERASAENAEVAGVEKLVHVMQKPLDEFKKPTHKPFDKGLLITNPPYGERLGEQQTLLPLYEQLGDSIKRDFGGWTAAVFTGNIELGRSLGLSSRKKYRYFNGPIESELLLFDVFDIADRKEAKEAKSKAISDGTQMMINRLQKNHRQLKNWLSKLESNCYRIYDADLPEYSAAIDIYDGHVHVQEYAPPKSVDIKKAKLRLDEILMAAARVFECDVNDISLKTRQRQQGKDQYEKMGRKESLKRGLNESSDRSSIVVQEGKAKLKVDLWSYLDSGLFLDHRLVRLKIAELAMGKRFLNLFCYTASATVHAALGGASSSVSVDMSKTYLDWARDNFALNNVSDRHQLVQADCMQWLKQCREGFDLIFLDPPSFSNSKRMEGVLDVQRDHVALIKRCLDILKPGGVLIFSTNLKKFKFDFDAFSKVECRDISAQTIDKDFERNKKIHQCFWLSNN